MPEKYLSTNETQKNKNAVILSYAQLLNYKLIVFEKHFKTESVPGTACD